MSNRSRETRSEFGATAVVVALTLTLMFSMIAFAIDLSLLRDDRRADQKIADAAAAAGTIQLATTHGKAACEVALDYLELNTPGVSSFTGADCSGFPIYCDPSTSSYSTTGTAGPYTVEVVWPVSDTHTYMQRASAIGAPLEPLSGTDGSNCDRLAVAITYDRPSQFANVLGVAEQSTRVHSVARVNTLLGGLQPINLLILERTECNAMLVSGQANVVVAPIVDALGVEHPGILAVDSDGSDPTTCDVTLPYDGNGTVQVTGSTASLRSDGPPGCPAEITAGTGEGCGRVELFAPGVPGPASPLYCQNEAYLPACDVEGVGATLRPHPQRMAERRTREPVDHYFNCKTLAAYELESWFPSQEIDGCANAATVPPYIDDLAAYVDLDATTTPVGFSEWSSPCVLDGSTGDITVPEGNWRVTCSKLEIKKNMTFLGGNIIFDGDVVVTAQGSLTIHDCGRTDTCSGASNGLQNSDGNAFFAGQNFKERTYSNDAAWVVFRSGGSLQKAGAGQLYIYDSVVYLPSDAFVTSSSPATALDLQGSSSDGALVWEAPTAGPFAILALWSDATNQHLYAGQSALGMEGLFFSPVAKAVYTGQGGQEQVNAQFITLTLEVKGSGRLSIAPQANTGIIFETEPRTFLIR